MKILVVSLAISVTLLVCSVFIMITSKEPSVQSVMLIICAVSMLVIFMSIIGIIFLCSKEIPQNHDAMNQ